MDGEAAAKRDYIRKHGSIPTGDGASATSGSTKLRRHLEKISRESCKPLIAEFRSLSLRERRDNAFYYREAVWRRYERARGVVRSTLSTRRRPRGGERAPRDRCCAR